MIVAAAAAAVVVGAAIQRITGLGFALVIVGPFVLLFGPLAGVTLVVMLSVVAAMSAIPFVWRDIDLRRSWRLIWPGLLTAPFAAYLVSVLPDAALELGVAGMAALALVAGRLPSVSGALTGRVGAWTAGGLAGFLHTAGGLSGPPLAAYGVGTNWDQRGFVASLQVVFTAFSIEAVALRGLPETDPPALIVLAVATVAGVAVGSWAVRHVPPRTARVVMLVIAWIGAALVGGRGILTLLS